MASLWTPYIYDTVHTYCNEIGSRTFTLAEVFEAKQQALESFSPNNNHVRQKLAEQLQILVRDEKITRLERGTYTLVVDFLPSDNLTPEEEKIVQSHIPEKREYWVESFTRNQSWVKQAKEKLGYYCLCHNCQNSFNKEDGTPYIEVHHIIPMREGVEDSINNLSVLCAHHHRFAHFATSKDRKALQEELLEKVTERLSA
jgi:predicted HNH restriction endonuclease